MSGLPPGWRIVDMFPERIEQHLKDVARVAKELEALPKIKRPATKEQSAETQRLLDNQAKRPPWQDEAYAKERWIQEMPDGVQHSGDYSSADGIRKAVGTREVTPLEMDHYPRNMNAQIWGGGRETSPERRNKASEAFSYSKPATPSDEDLKRLTKLSGLEAVAVTEVPKEEQKPVKNTWYVRALEWVEARLPEWTWK